MQIDRSSPILCFVHSASDLEADLTLIAGGGKSWGSLDIIQVRGKDMPAGDLETLVRCWIETVASFSTLIVVNDRLDVTLAAEADGVHVGRGDLPPEQIREEAPPDLVVGVSTHDRQEILLAQGAGASYAGLGAFYESPTKRDARVLDPWKAGLKETIPALTIPVLAIGGITVDRVPEVFSMPPVTGIAVSAAIQKAGDPADAVEDLRSAIDRAWMERPE